MTTLAALWLPILLSVIAVFVASSVIHMGPFWHRTDFPKLPDEDAVLNALRPLAIPPGDYFFPRASGMKDMQSPEFLERVRRGPVAVMTVMPNEVMGMGRNLTLWFLYCGVITVFAAYVAGRALPPRTEFAEVFRYACTTAFLGYVGALWQLSIWYRRAWSITIKWSVDGLIYAALTGAIMGWLWPR